MNKICYGCGAKLQCTDKNVIGYIPESKIDDAKYCMRCFRMMHYGEVKVTKTPKSSKEIINKINKDKKFVIFLVDFLNINEYVMDLFKSIKKEKLLIINKCELMPKSINKEHFLNFIRKYYNIKDNIKIKGGKNSHGAKSVLNYLEENNIKEAYILGLSNSGKSTLINDLIDICNTKVNKTTVNKTANTTVDFIRVKINSNLTLIDSPGFIMDDAITSDTTTKLIVAYSMNMKECETVSILDNSYFLKFDENTPIVFYTNSISNKTIKKIYYAAPGLKNTINVENGNTDIIIKGIGFITVKRPVNITTSIDLKYIEVRPSMFGDTYE